MQLQEDEQLFRELELCLGLNNFYYEDVAEVSKQIIF